MHSTKSFTSSFCIKGGKIHNLLDISKLTWLELRKSSFLLLLYVFRQQYTIKRNLQVHCFLKTFIVQLQLSPYPPHYSPLPYPAPAPTFNPAPHCLCSWVLYTCSLTQPFPFFPVLPPSHLPSGQCMFVLYFHAATSILLTCSFCWLGSTYRWDHMVFVFHHLAHFI